MATLLEQAQIEEWSVMDPGEPPDPNIVLARQLRGRIRALLYRKAFTFMQATQDPEGKEQRALLAFAQQTLRNPGLHLEASFHVALAQSPGAATVDEILNITDQQLNTIFSVNVLSSLAFGLQPGLQPGRQT